MAKIKQIVLCGVGGQGIILAGTLLGHAAFCDGKWVSGANAYGAAARGGLCRAGVVISDWPISFPHVIEADILVAMYQAAYDKYIVQVKCETGVVIYDDNFVSPEEIDGLKYVNIPATRTAVEELDSGPVANIIILSAAVAITGVVTKDALKSAIEKIVPGRFKELDLKAVDIGIRLGKERLTCR
ncbi:2-oxoacid:acceptor oxidoreductase family protein [Chloroflexota bacterium]